MRTMRIYFSVFLGLLLPFLVACGDDKEEEDIPLGTKWDDEVNNRFYKGDILQAKENYRQDDEESVFLDLTGENINRSGMPFEVWFRDDYLYLPYPSPGDSLYARWNAYWEKEGNKIEPVFIRQQFTFVREVHGDMLATPDKSLGVERMGGKLWFRTTGMADTHIFMTAIYPEADSLELSFYSMMYRRIKTLPEEGAYHVFDTEAEAKAFIRESLGMGN